MPTVKEMLVALKKALFLDEDGRSAFNLVCEELAATSSYTWSPKWLKIGDRPKHLKGRLNPALTLHFKRSPFYKIDDGYLIALPFSPEENIEFRIVVYWVQDGRVYTVNEAARYLSSHLPRAKDVIQEESVVKGLQHLRVKRNRALP